MQKKRTLRQSLSLILVVCLMAGMLTPFAATGPEDIPEEWKFMELFSSDYQAEITRSHFQNNVTTVAQVFNPASHALTLRFTLQFGQPVKIGIYTVANCSDVEDMKDGMQVIPATFVGYLIGTINDTEYAFDENATPNGAYKFSGFYDDMPESYPDFSWETLPEEDVDGSMKRNSIRWSGMVQTADGPINLAEYKEGLGFYAISIEPTDPRTSQYISYLGMITDTEVGTEIIGSATYAEQKFNPANPFAGDPVNMVSGNLLWQYTDLVVFGSTPLSFTRTYNSLDKTETDMGWGWRHAFSYYIDLSPLYARVYFPDGASHSYQLNYDGSYTVPKGTSAVLSAAGSGYVLETQEKTTYFYSSDGTIERIEYANGDEISFNYTSGKLTSVSNSAGSLSFSYDSSYISSVTDGNGKTAYFDYDNNGNLEAVTNPDGDTLNYAYDSNHNLLSVVDFNGETYMENDYDDYNRVIEQYLAGEGTSYFRYDSSNRTNIYINPEGAQTTYVYNSDNVITEIIDNYGSTSYGFDGLGRATSISDKLGNTIRYGYDDSGNRDSITYPDGTSESFRYNDLNLVTWHQRRDNSVVEYGYDSRGNMTSYTDARSNTSTFTYDSDNNMLTSTDALGNTTVFTHDSKGNVLTQTDPENNVTTFEYDDQGRLVLQINPDDDPANGVYSRVEYQYTTAGKLVKIIDPAGNETEYLVNGNGFDTGTIDPMGFETSTEYNEQNKPVRVTDAMDNATEYSYDESGNLTVTTDALGGKVTYGYDPLGRMTSMADARNNTWHYSYDAEGRMTGTRDPLNGTTSSVYDSMGRVTKSTNARNYATEYFYDAMGRTTGIKDALGYTTTSVYDDNGNLVRQIDKNGNVWEYEFDANNRLVKTIDPQLNETSCAYNANGQVVKTTLAMNAQVESVYDKMGRLVKSIDAEGNETAYSYDILGRVVKVTFADGTFVENSYNANGWLVTALDQNGAGTHYEYNRNGQVTKITDALGGVTEYFYDALGRTTMVRDALGGETSFDYDANGNLTRETNALDGETTYIYDALGRVISTTDPNGNEFTLEYDQNGNVVRATNPDTGVIQYFYDELDRLSHYIDAEGNTFRFEYDGNGNTVATVDARLNRSTKVYDQLNRVTQSIDAAGFSSFVEYDADGRVSKVTNAEGAETSYSYDLNGNILKMTDALGNKTHFTYDSMNRIETMTDARGAVTAYTYTPTGLVETVTDAYNEVYSYEYDLLGRLTKETNELGESTSYTYDSLGRVLSVTNALGFTDRFTYDALGNIKTVTDKNGNVTSYNYDPNGNVIETIDALGTSALFEYDSMDRLVKMTLSRKSAGVDENQVTLYSYDKRGLVTKEINAAGNETLYIYDGNGNLIQKTDADGHVTEYGYDPRNLVEAINYSDGSEVLFAYNGNGELVAMMDWNGVTSFELDLLGRIASVNDHNEKVTRYTYDSVGNQTSMTYPDGTVARYEYDLLGRMTKLTDAERQNTVYAYDAASRLISQAKGNGWSETHTYDAVGQLTRTLATAPSTSVSHPIEHTYQYDPNGNLTHEYRSGAGGQDRYNLTHTYDALNRLTGTTGDQGFKAHSYSYDSLGNLISETIHGKTDTYSYNSLNQITQKTVAGKDTYSYSYDSRGNLIQVVYGKKNTVVEQYVYDSTNRMVKGINAAGEESHYIFNGLGYLVGNEWIIEKNNYGYTGVETDPSEQVDGVVRVCTAHKNQSGQGHQNPTGAGHFKDKGQTNNGGNTTGGTEGGVLPTLGKKQAVVHKDYVLDYTSALKDVIMETESGVGGLTYRYVYGLEKENVVIKGITNGAGSVMQYVYNELEDGTGEWVLESEAPAGNVQSSSIVKLWYHHDRLGSTDFLTDNVRGKVTSYTTYDDWGSPTMKAILRMGVRELDLVTEYTGHPYDAVLSMYFAEARMYDAGDRRFVAMDALRDGMAWYVYSGNNPTKYVDLNGLYYVKEYNSNTYYAVPQSQDLAVLSTAVSVMPGYGGMIAEAFKFLESFDKCGGNSFHPVQNLVTAIWDDVGYEDKFKEQEFKKALSKMGDKLAGETAKTVINFLNALSFWSELSDAMEIPDMDIAVFKLFELSNIEPKSSTVKRVEFMMTAAYAFVSDQKWFFVDSAYTAWSLHPVTNAALAHNGPALFSILAHVQSQRDTDQFHALYNSYYEKLRCNAIDNAYLNNLYCKFEVVLPGQGPLANPTKTLITVPFDHYALSNYNSVINQTVNSFKLHIESWMYIYDSAMQAAKEVNSSKKPGGGSTPGSLGGRHEQYIMPE